MSDVIPASAQLVVVGAGPGGYHAAFKAAELGLSVTLIDPAVNPGGVCLYRGRIPCGRTGSHGYTVRILPFHPTLSHKLEVGILRWA